MYKLGEQRTFDKETSVERSGAMATEVNLSCMEAKNFHDELYNKFDDDVNVDFVTQTETQSGRASEAGMFSLSKSPKWCRVLRNVDSRRCCRQTKQMRNTQRSSADSKK